MFFLGSSLLIICFLSFWYLWIVDSRFSWIITPFLLFAVLEMTVLWPSVIYAYYRGLSRDAYPMVVTALAFACFLAGFATFRWLRLGQARSPKGFLVSPLEMPLSQTRYIVAITLTTIVLLGMGVYLYRGIPPFIKYLLGWAPAETTHFVSESRKLFTKSHYFGGEYRGQGLIRSFMGVGWPFLVAISLTIYDKTKKKCWLLVTLFFLLLSFVFVAGDGTRAPFIFAMLCILIVISMIRRLRISYYLLIIIGLFVITIGLSLASGKIIYGEQNRDITFAMQKILKRISVDNGINSVSVIEFVRSGILDLRGGEVHWEKALNALPGPRFSKLPFSHELSHLLGKGSETSFSSTTYMGTIYVDFGLAGVITVYTMIGCTIGLVHRILFNGKKTPLRLAVIGFTTFYLGMMSLNGFVGFISSYIVVIVVYFIFKMAAILQPIFTTTHANTFSAVA